MSEYVKHVAFQGRLVMIGFGSIGQGVLPLLLRHVAMTSDQITIITADDRGLEEARAYGVEILLEPMTRENYLSLLEGRIGAGDFLLNLSVDVSSLALVEYCQARAALYLDTCIEPWVGGYTDPAIPAARRTNYAFREGALELRARYPGGHTAVMTHGANPGVVSHFVKQALLNIAADTGVETARPTTRAQWGQLAARLGVKVIHIAERDTQVTNQPKRPGEFVNTWSIDGFCSEGLQPSELGWGSHERHWPADGNRHDFGCRAAIYLSRPGASVRVRTWTPMEGPFHGFLITHGESISIADYFTVREGDQVTYRPTVHYAYHPCDDAVLSLHEMAGKNWVQQDRQRLLVKEITEGVDELGVLLMGHAKGAYWYGSQLSIEEARRLVPLNSATSLQVTAGVLGGVVWAMRHPRAGVVDPDEIDFEEALAVIGPYLGPVVGVYSDWTPLLGRGGLFSEDVDADDPWQFKNFRVV
ncbi:MAG: homospermidine synthase [Alphaproteobacteria bacterium]